MKYAVINFDNMAWEADVMLFDSDKDAHDTMLEYFYSDLEVELRKANIEIDLSNGVPKDANLDKHCVIIVAANSIMAEMINGDIFKYQVICLDKIEKTISFDR